MAVDFESRLRLNAPVSTKAKLIWLRRRCHFRLLRWYNQQKRAMWERKRRESSGRSLSTSSSSTGTSRRCSDWSQVSDVSQDFISCDLEALSSSGSRPSEDLSASLESLFFEWGKERSGARSYFGRHQTRHFSSFRQADKPYEVRIGDVVLFARDVAGTEGRMPKSEIGTLVDLWEEDPPVSQPKPTEEQPTEKEVSETTTPDTPKGFARVEVPVIEHGGSGKVIMREFVKIPILSIYGSVPCDGVL